MFAGHIGRAVAKADQAGDRGGVDDRAPAVAEHVLDFVLHAQPHALQVDANDLRPALFRIVAGLGHAALDAGIVERAVETAVGLDGLPHQGLDLGRLGDIGFDEGGLTACGADEAGRLLAGLNQQVRHHDLRALTGKLQRGRPADSAAAARHQGNPSVKRSRHAMSPF